MRRGKVKLLALEGNYGDADDDAEDDGYIDTGELGRWSFGCVAHGAVTVGLGRKLPRPRNA